MQTIPPTVSGGAFPPGALTLRSAPSDSSDQSDPFPGSQSAIYVPAQYNGTSEQRDHASTIASKPRAKGFWCHLLAVACLSGLLVLPLRLVSAESSTPATNRPASTPVVHWGDTSRLGRPFAKDPSVIAFGGRYLLYYSLPPFGDNRPNDGWAVGIAASTNLVDWTKIGEVLPAQECDRKGLAAPCAIVLKGKVHLFYQTYGNGPRDAICHAVSEDGLHFERDASNPIFRPTGDWNNGRAIDADVFPFRGRLLLHFATRDPSGRIQILGVAGADLNSDFSRAAWRQLCDGPVLKPELPWEQQCIEAPSVCQQGDRLYLFYAGAYNNAPQQIGVAVSQDGISWQRLFCPPFLPNGKPGEWNASESGHPGIFVAPDGQSYLFFQGNPDKGRTWYLSRVRVSWKEGKPQIVP